MVKINVSLHGMGNSDWIDKVGLRGYLPSKQETKLLSAEYVFTYYVTQTDMPSQKT